MLLGPMGRWSPKGHLGPLAQITEAAAVAFPGKQQGHFATLPKITYLYNNFPFGGRFVTIPQQRERKASCDREPNVGNT